MKNILKQYLVILSIFASQVPLNSFAQSKELLERISLYQTVCRLNYEQKYDSIILLSRGVPSRDSLYLYGIEGYVSKAYFEGGNKPIGFQYLTKEIENDEFYDLDQFRYSYSKYKLDSNKEYRYLVQNFDKIKSRYYKSLDLPVLKECLEIFYTDQRLRYIWFASKDSVERKNIDMVMWHSDSMNVVNMKQLLNRCGHYPGISEVGKSFTYYFIYIVKHFASELDRDTLYLYLKTATLNGQLPNWYGPSMLDKIESQNQRPLIYGEYGNSDDYSDGTYTYEPIRDIEHVDKRRAEFLLPPLHRSHETQKCVLPNGYDPLTQK